MTFIRHVVKIFGKRYFNYLMRPIEDPLKTQEALLAKLIRINQNTQFGKKHKFQQITSIRKFQDFVIPHSYEYFRPYIESMTNGAEDILVPGGPYYWGKTAGTTGAPKLIPITPQSIKNATNGVLRIYFSYIAENPKEHSKFLDGTVCFLHAPAVLDYINNTPVGFGTGIFGQYARRRLWAPFVQRMMYSTAHLLQIEDLNQRFRYMTHELLQKNITAFAGVTSYVMSIIEIILKFSQRIKSGVKTIIDLFPNCQLLILGGESPQFYEQRLFSLIGKKINYREVYGATEEIIAVQLQKNPGLTPLLDANFVEFCAENSEERLLVHEIKKNVNYKIILTNFNGLYAYILGDIVKFISTNPPRLLFLHREGTINMVSEKMTVQQITDALTLTNQKFNCAIKEYCVVGKYTPKPHYIFIIEYLPGKTPSNEKDYLNALNQNLLSINPVYREQLTVIPTMQTPQLLIVKDGTFFELEQANLESGVPMGQYKIKHLSTEEKYLKQFSNYIIKEVNID